MIAENHLERGTLMLDFRVETFLAVCRHMNFTKAARELSITQPAVSHHIRYLEQAYGAALFRLMLYEEMLCRGMAADIQTCRSIFFPEGGDAPWLPNRAV